MTDNMPENVFIRRSPKYVSDADIFEVELLVFDNERPLYYEYTLTSTITAKLEEWEKSCKAIQTANKIYENQYKELLLERNHLRIKIEAAERMAAALKKFIPDYK